MNSQIDKIDIPGIEKQQL